MRSVMERVLITLLYETYDEKNNQTYDYSHAITNTCKCSKEQDTRRHGTQTQLGFNHQIVWLNGDCIFRSEPGGFKDITSARYPIREFNLKNVIGCKSIPNGVATFRIATQSLRTQFLQWGRVTAIG